MMETNGIAKAQQGRNTRLVVSMFPLSCHGEEKLEPRVGKDAIKKLKFKLDLEG